MSTHTKSKYFTLFWALLCAAVCFSPLSAQSNDEAGPAAPSAPKTYASSKIENEFIKIIVNEGPQSLGRFAIETTGGDPSSPSDNNQPLIYGRPVPWTSYTTVRIDGVDFIFGGPEPKTGKRAGKALQYGKVLSQTVGQSDITTVCLFGSVRVSQRLSFFRNLATRVNDSTLISYDVDNQDSVPHSVGIRIMVDTKLGSNDGAPFRIGRDSQESETLFSGSAITDYWQTFDSLTSPTIIAQGTLRIPDEGVFPPARMVIANWGTLSDSPWDFDYHQGRPFTREGETEKDTALALYWEPVSVSPGKTETVKTVYGLGGLTLSAGALSLGLTASTELYSTYKYDFLVMGYVMNTGGFDSKDTVASFDLPPGFKPVGGTSIFGLGLLGAGQTAQVPLKVRLVGPKIGKQKIVFKVKSGSLESNSISREINIVAPPGLKAEFVVPDFKTVTYDEFVDAVIVLTNPNSFRIDDLRVSLIPSENAVFPPYEMGQKTVRTLKANSSISLNWRVKLEDFREKWMSLRAIVSSPVTSTQVFSHTTKTNRPASHFQINPSAKEIDNGDFFYLDFSMLHATSFKRKTFTIQFDPAALRYIRSSPEPFAIGPLNPDSELQVEEGLLTVPSLSNDQERGLLPIYKFHFQSLQYGDTKIVLKEGDKILYILPLNIARPKNKF